MPPERPGPKVCGWGLDFQSICYRTSRCIVAKQCSWNQKELGSIKANCTREMILFGHVGQPASSIRFTLEKSRSNPRVRERRRVIQRFRKIYDKGWTSPATKSRAEGSGHGPN